MLYNSTHIGLETRVCRAFRWRQAAPWVPRVSFYINSAHSTQYQERTSILPTCPSQCRIEVSLTHRLSGLQLLEPSKRSCMQHHLRLTIVRTSFCEEDFVVSAWIAEFVNTISNIAYGASPWVTIEHAGVY